MVEIIAKECVSINECLLGLKRGYSDKSQVLYNIMELEVFLGNLETIGRAMKHKYESRFAANLRDICLINNPMDLSEDQIKCFSSAIRTLMNGWGNFSRKKANHVRSLLLDADLTWLPK